MQAAWLWIAAWIEFSGAVFITSYIVRAAWLVLRGGGMERIKATLAAGAVTGLDFKMGATLLKALSLYDWPQIGKFAAILLLRAVLKRNFSSGK